MSFSSDFLIVGHRGAAGLEPENTLRSFKRAYALGVDAVELDVRQVDGKLIVMHDESVERTTNGTGKLGAYTVDTLRALDAGLGERVPYLSEVLQQLPGGVGVNIELKGRNTGIAVAKAIANSAADILVSSFDRRELKQFRGADEATKCAPLFSRRNPSMLNIAAELDAWSINVSDRIASRATIDAIVAGEFRALVYTVNDVARGRRLKGFGSSGIFTDRPDLFEPFRKHPRAD